MCGEMMPFGVTLDMQFVRSDQIFRDIEQRIYRLHPIERGKKMIANITYYATKRVLDENDGY
jgi:hypothetical protein